MRHRSLLFAAIAAGVLLAFAMLIAVSQLVKKAAKKGSKHELSFWSEYLHTRGSYQGVHWTEDYNFRLDPLQPLQEHVIRYLDAPPSATVSILDVGSGPLTKLGKRWEGRNVEITAVDVLGDEYNRLLHELGLTPPVRTQQGEVERLTEYFPKNSFDLVYMENALDHSRDPLLGIRQMLEVVKLGGYILLRHYENEAETANYKGFHRWNFCENNGHFVIWNRKSRLSVNDILGNAAEVTAIAQSTQDREQDREAEVIVSLRKR
jgi:SAM-dependent methyltransferase